MGYERELEFFELAMGKLRIQTMRIPLSDMSFHRPDFGLRAFLGHEARYERALREFFRNAGDNVVYRLLDEFECSYYFFLLPDLPEQTAMLVGPFSHLEITREDLRKKAAALGVEPERYVRFESYFASVPVISDGAPIHAMVSALGERLWGGANAFEIEDISLAFSDLEPASQGSEEKMLSDEELLQRMRLLEERYALENRMMELVSKGRSQQVLLSMGKFSSLTMESRSPEPMRNAKNYAIILNTILRKAVERGGVHPLYIDRISSDFARRIERGGSWKDFGELLQTMVRDYCALVKRFAIADYSPLVQRVIARVDLDLTADLSLNAHAEALEVNSSYLSALFKKETGQTITEFVMTRRMDHAKFLLRSTRLSVSEVARQCGISDDNYFTKLFKKYVGETPRQYRQNDRRYSPKEAR